MCITVYTEDQSQQVNDLKRFMKDYKLVKAAGGVVTDDDARVLLIFRKGKWDLPKGKVEDNEPLELCANREVVEETGLSELALRTPLAVTYHTYTEKGQKTVVIEDLISTGKSSLQVVEALRKADLEVMGMVSIFNYGFSTAKEAFERASVIFYSLTNYPTMISLAIEKGIVTPEQEGVLLKWQENPSTWSGF